MEKKIKRLYFIRGMVPTAEESAEAQRLGITAFRNGTVAARADTVEPADVVAGLVPVGYLELKGCKILEQGKAAKNADGGK